jgi:hypothetical protein
LSNRTSLLVYKDVEKGNRLNASEYVFPAPVLPNRPISTVKVKCAT